MEEVIVTPYNPDWKNEFEREQDKIRLALKGLDVHIEHIGSTSVMGLGSKPTIDIMAGVLSLTSVNEHYIENLARLGYEYVFKPEFPERLFFRRGPWRAGTHHLHIYKYKGPQWNDQILFREYLKNHPDTRDQYYALKKVLESQYKHDRVAYTNGKADFIREVIQKARLDRQLES
ncbi:GrpB family protein [Paenibacillus lautus]|uniref:GrpB family protein n=1 Tax=Paenibacillus lautus TaxID=1401 RepID=UPI000FDBA32B|nr:GrpB family protein [Paenibacillus lautus]